MGAKREFRNRPAVEVDILDALVDRGDGMTVLELRSVVDADIDRIEGALADLKDDQLITIEEHGTRLEIHPAQRVIPEPGERTEPDSGLIDAVRERLGL
ncbi:DUF6432 family protein [Natronocalculus amylovorans]|uniref:DUF6432 family protein n=1 Tax=Natronocalculus amylovorans TaxID=2917812 RepID=A0AAE3FU58_9EURY|nr:DUF6432 family protein [Natronocalculus amylovorans]MCL9815657.1 DUF6432 family protein [Natronocalculus amylovorans]NUE01830.1 MarR family transcriptional regulator [Halorubraceae archaeon YAN]